MTRQRAARVLAATAVLTALLAHAATAQPAPGAQIDGTAPRYVAIPGASFRSALPPDGKDAAATVAAFRMRVLPVTNGEFLAFVRQHPQWQRGHVPALFADPGYLSQWATPLSLGITALPDQPVTQVSWFAARAYCASEGARLPTWYEWELVAAAGDDQRRDARADPAWREQLLEWYSKPTGTLPVVQGGPLNAYGVADMHAAVWEWVDDFASILVSTDNRDQGDPDRLKFCGAAALTMQDRDNYAILMRLAMLSSLKASYTTANLGFRCVRDDAGGTSPPGARP